MKEALRQDLGITYVPRWAIVPLMRPQSVAEHSWRVARIAMWLADELGMGHLRNSVAARAVMHDVGEAITGDLPRTTKQEDPIYDDIHLVMKLADYAEAWAYIRMWGIGKRAVGVDKYLWGLITALVAKSDRPATFAMVMEKLKEEIDGV